MSRFSAGVHRLPVVYLLHCHCTDIQCALQDRALSPVCWNPVRQGRPALLLPWSRLCVTSFTQYQSSSLCSGYPGHVPSFLSASQLTGQCKVLGEVQSDLQLTSSLLLPVISVLSYRGAGRGGGRGAGRGAGRLQLINCYKASVVGCPVYP